MEDLNVELFFHRERLYFVKIDLQLKSRFEVNSILYLVLFFKGMLKEYCN